MTLFAPIRTLTLLALVACSSGVVFAQHGGGPGGGGMGRGMGMPGGMGGGGHHGGDGGGFPHGNSVPHGNTPSSGTSHGGLRLGPPGRWWDDKKYTSALGIEGEQKKRMDNVFNQHRDELVSRYQSLQNAQNSLEKLTKSDHPDQGALFSGIDHVAQARADLEKANTSMLLGIRGEMTPEQIDKLEDIQ